MENKRFLLLDCDGVVWRGKQVIYGAQKTLQELQNIGFKLGFVTNNSSLSREGFRRKFTSLDFDPEHYFIVNSAYGAAIYLKEHDHKRSFVIGEKGLVEELQIQSIYTTDIYEMNLDSVVIGWDRQLTWRKLADAMRIILYDNGLFLGTNPDNSYPIEDFLVPGAGAGIAALSTACGKEPDRILGKPDRYLIDLICVEMNCTNYSEAVFIGDRLSTDIAAGINAGMDTILVQTGISDHHLKEKIIPSVEIESINEIFSILT